MYTALAWDLLVLAALATFKKVQTLTGWVGFVSARGQGCPVVVAGCGPALVAGRVRGAFSVLAAGCGLGGDLPAYELQSLCWRQAASILAAGWRAGGWPLC